MRQTLFLRVIRHIWTAYSYFYYRIYASNLRVAGESDLPQWNAMFAATFMSFLNFITIALSISAFLGWNPAFDATKLQIAPLVLVWAIVNYYLLVHNEKYKRIAANFKNEKIARKKRNLCYCWLYVLLSFGAAVVSALFA